MEEMERMLAVEIEDRSSVRVSKLFLPSYTSIFSHKFTSCKALFRFTPQFFIFESGNSNIQVHFNDN